MYQNYVFDLYGTLVDIRTDEEQEELWAKIQQLYGFHGAYYSVKELKEAYAEFCKIEAKKLVKFDQPEIQIEKVFRALYEEKGVTVSEELVNITGEMFRIFSTKFIRLYDGVTDFLKELKRKEKNIYLLSNAQRIFTEPEIRYLKIWDYFDGILISSVESCKKPSPEFFHILIDRYHLNVKESIMIGNDGTSDIKGAEGVGMDTLYIHSEISPQDEKAEDIKATYVIPDGDFRKISDIILK